MSGLDLERLRGWIGRSETASDVIAPRLARELSVATGGAAAAWEPGDVAPLGIHWCLAPHTVAADALGPDGHPARGGFLPPVALPRRMWAGGALAFADPLRIGDVVERRSTIAEVTAKQGRSGALCFVTVRHDFSTDRGHALSERHDIVYRDAAPASAEAARPPAAPVPDGSWRREVQADAVTLFRYSAVTFNGHRIHYDRAYATGEEGYPGLVVHGPLQATLLLQFARDLRANLAGPDEAAPSRFAFRGVAPLFDGDAFGLHADETADGLHLETRSSRGAHMSAEAGWR